MEKNAIKKRLYNSIIDTIHKEMSNFSTFEMMNTKLVINYILTNRIKQFLFPLGRNHVRKSTYDQNNSKKEHTQLAQL